LFIEASNAVPDRLNQIILTELGKEIEKERINSDLDWLKGATDKEL
jgi:hypothetical protein